MPNIVALLEQNKPFRTRRKQPTTDAKERILDAQKNRCFYCGMTFGDWFLFKNFAKPVELCWDHFVPYSYGFNSSNANFVAACRQCNGIKTNHVFDDIKELVDYVRTKRQKRGLPLRPMWGDIQTQKIVAEILFCNLQDSILLDETSKTPEQVIEECREWRRLRRILNRRKPVAQPREQYRCLYCRVVLATGFGFCNEHCRFLYYDLGNSKRKNYDPVKAALRELHKIKSVKEGEI